MLFIGICGASGSGKSTLAHALEEKLGKDRCLVMQQDSYYRDHSHLTFEQRVKLNYDEKPREVSFLSLDEEQKKVMDSFMTVRPVKIDRFSRMQ